MTQVTKNAASNQSWMAENYAKNARFVSDLAEDILSWLDPKPGERILDIGCGDGALTAQIAATGAETIGLDASDSMIGAARARGVDARLGDGETLEFDGEFDAVFSNAVLHWMLNADAVVAGVRRALKPGGRFVAEFGGHGNVAAIVTALRAVAARRGASADEAALWFFPSPSEYRIILEEHGFKVARIGLFPRPTPLDTGMKAWLMTFRAPFFAQFDDEMDAVLEEVTGLLAPALCDSKGNWTADYVRLRVEAHRE